MYEYHRSINRVDMLLHHRLYCYVTLTMWIRHSWRHLVGDLIPQLEPSRKGRAQSESFQLLPLRVKSAENEDPSNPADLDIQWMKKSEDKNKGKEGKS
jgi:hypothetical protein